MWTEHRVTAGPPSICGWHLLRTALVISSTKSGSPSAFAIICSMTAGGSDASAFIESIIAVTSCRPRRLIARLVACGCSAQDRPKSERAEMTASIRQCAMRSRIRFSNSKEVGSIQ